MNTKHLISIMFCCLTALCITSCLNSDDNNKSSWALSKAEIAQCFQTVAGNYTGDLLYRAKSDDGRSEQIDTLDASWYIPTDSTLFITNFPGKVLAEYVSNQALKEALASAPDQVVKCQIGFLQTSPVEFLINPYTIEYNLQYSGSQHKIHVVFYANNTYSFGALDPTSKELMVKIIPATLYVDGQQTSYLTSSQLIFLSKKHEAI